MNHKVEDSSDIEAIINLDEEYKNQICILPDNVFRKKTEEEYFYAFSLPTIKKVLKQGDLKLHQFDSLASPNLIDQRGIDYFAPVILVGSMFFSQNPEAVNIALNLISSYLFKIFSNDNKAKANFTIYARDDKNKKTKRIHYDGPVEGIKDLGEVLEKTFKDFEG